MFQDSVRALVERQCEALKLDASVLGQKLASCNPYREDVEPSDIAQLSEICRSVAERGDSLGVKGIATAAAALDREVATIASQPAVEPWELVRLMEMQASLAAAVDELEAEHSAFFCACSEPSVLEVAPFPDESGHLSGR